MCFAQLEKGGVEILASPRHLGMLLLTVDLAWGKLVSAIRSLWGIGLRAISLTTFLSEY